MTRLENAILTVAAVKSMNRSEPAPQPPSVPILEYSADRVGSIWTPSDHDAVVHAFRQVEQLAEDLIRKAQSALRDARAREEAGI